MNLKLVLTSAPVSLESRYGDFSGAANTEPSFGLVCLGTMALHSGVQVKLVEASSFNLSIEETLDEIVVHDPDVVGITATTVGINSAGILAERLKSINSNTIVLIGGPHATALPEETLNTFKGFDLVVMSEGEETLIELLKEISENKEVPSGINGTAERIDNKIRINPAHPFIKNLDELPLPVWSLLSGFPDAFRPSPSRIRKWPCASIVLTRGCPNKCTFCDRSIFGNKCRGYSPKYSLQILKDLHHNYGVNEILIEDDTFIINRKNVVEFCESIISDKLDISWSCLGRADRVDQELLKLMKKAGCWHISFGIESGDPGILKKVNKKLDINQIQKAVAWSKEAGIKTKGFFMVGFPGETQETIQATVNLAKKLPLSDISVMQLTPFPGSEVYDIASKVGEFDPDWTKMNTLNTVFIPKGLTKEDIEKGRSDILKAFYLRPGVIMSHMLHMIKNPHMMRYMFSAFKSFLKVIKGTSNESQTKD